MYAPQHPSTQAATSRYAIPAQRSIDSTAVFDALADSDCRQIIEATADEAMTATELSTACDIPTSTLYRKLELVTDAGLVEERIRIRKNGKHASEYRRNFDDLTVTLSEGHGVELDVSLSGESSTAEALLAIDR